MASRAALILSFVAFCTALHAQSPATVTTEVVFIGGANAPGSEGGNPPTLSNGTTLATGEMTFTYDRNTCDLTLVVKNTSPVVTGQPTPVIKNIFFNLPQLAVGNICLVSQNAEVLNCTSTNSCGSGGGSWGGGWSWGGWGSGSGSSCSSGSGSSGSGYNNNCGSYGSGSGYGSCSGNDGTFGGWGGSSGSGSCSTSGYGSGSSCGSSTSTQSIDWDFSKDTNLENGSSLTCGSFGGFGVRLKVQYGTEEAIANPSAPCTTSSGLVGTATFVFHVTGISAKNLTAGAFSRSQSSGANQVNAALKFTTTGNCPITGCIGNDKKCSSGGWTIGRPVIGTSVYAVETAADGCYGCIICSLTPGPTIAFGLVAPVGTPYTVILSQQFPNNTLANFVSVEIPIPNDPAFVGVTYYCATVIVNTATQAFFDISPGWTTTVLAQ